MECFKGKNQVDKCLFTFASNMHNNKNLIFKRILCFKDIIKVLETVLLDKISLDKYMDTLLTGLNQIINTKISEKYKLTKLLDDKVGFISQIDTIIGSWGWIRANVNRYLFPSLYRQESFLESVKKLNQVYQFEQIYHELLFDFLDKVSDS